MSRLFHCGSVRPELVRTDNTWELHKFLPETATFFQSRESIERFGLLYLPLLHPLADGGYEILTGRRCYLFFHSLGHEPEVPCRILVEGLSTSQVLALIHEEYTMRRSLTEIEQAHYLQLCQLKLSTEDQRRLFATLNLPVNPSALQRLLDLLSLDPPLQEALMTGEISVNIARELFKLSTSDRTAVFSLFRRLNIGGGKQKRMLSLLRDLAGRDDVSLREYIGREPFQAILNHPEMNVPQKSQAILHLLQHNHYPALNEAEYQFKNWEKGLVLPDNCAVTHSPAFEQDAVTLSVTFPAREKLEDCLQKIQLYFTDHS